MLDAGAHYDLIAIGGGPAGRQAAVEAARLGRRAAIVEREGALGGAAAVTAGTLRAAAVKLTGAAARREVTIDDLTWRTAQAIEHEQEAVADALRRDRVDVLGGNASFAGPHTLEIAFSTGVRRASAERFVIAVGTIPARPPAVAFDDRTVIDADGFELLPAIPRTLTIVGSGVIGLEYAAIAAALGCRVTLVHRHAHVLEFVDRELVEALEYHLRGLGVVLRLGAEAIAVERGPVTLLRGGERIASDAVMHTARRGATTGLRLRAAGLAADDRGRIDVAADQRTARPHIFAAGTVTGSPALAAAAGDQGRRAALAAFGVRALAPPAPLPHAIHTIPGIAYVGRDERALAAASVPYVRGVADYRELARGAIEGERRGSLKLLVHAATRRIEGVHVLGAAAAEIIHVGQTAMAAGLPVDHLAAATFVVPSFADAYRVAALDAAARLHASATIAAGRA